MRSSSFQRGKGEPTVPGYRCETNRGFTTTTEEHPQTRKDGLRHASLRVGDVDEAVRRAVVEAFAFGPHNLLPRDDTGAEMRRTLSALRTLDDEVNAIWALQDEGTLSPAQAGSRLRELRARRDPLEALMRSLQERSAAAHMVVDLRVDVVEGSRVRFEDVGLLKVHLRERFDALDVERQRLLVESLLEVTATGGRRSARSPQRFRIRHKKVISLNEPEESAA